ncbi:MAG: hypothetical protein ACRDRB_00075 [Pseudonocardiaceae bacterium]
MAASRIPIDPGHPLSGIATLSMTTATGEAEIVSTDGRILRGSVRPHVGPTAITRTVFDVSSSTLHMSMADGIVFTSQIGTVYTSVDRPVVYLDQNHWIDLARALSGSSSVTGEKEGACRLLIDLARNGDVILPLSAAHVVETTKKGGRQRTDVARTMVELSRGWQMRSPLWIRTFELTRLFTDSPSEGPDLADDVFTLTPEALWSDRMQPRREARVQDLPDGLQGLVDRIVWAAALTDVLLETVPEVSVPGLEMAAKWADSFHELAGHMRSNPRAKSYARDLTRSRFITDMQEDIARAALQGGLTTEQFGDWLQEDAEGAFHALPTLGRIREVLHLRLVNADDTWHRNDLNDVLHLCSAAGYADVVVGEKKTCNYLRRVEDQVPDGAQVFHRMTEALPTIERTVARQAPQA